MESGKHVCCVRWYGSLLCFKAAVARQVANGCRPPYVATANNAARCGNCARSGPRLMPVCAMLTAFQRSRPCQQQPRSSSIGSVRSRASWPICRPASALGNRCRTWPRWLRWRINRRRISIACTGPWRARHWARPPRGYA
ncbi:hypothetical protein XAR_4331 [Xanthomonas citri pv. glycines str. 8ra]|nr:hypothetical protein XAR_4331 [Xanthomonas citri pv. glycines str. 8ra]